LTFETTIRAMVGRLDLATNTEQLARRLDLDDLSQPSAVALSETGALAFVTVQGSNQVIVLNQLGVEIIRAATDLAPQGLAIDPVTKRVFTQNLMGRTVTVLDANRLLTQGTAELGWLGEIVVATEQLSASVLRGKKLFYNAADPRMSRDGYISCASCHLDGDHDAQVWDFTDRGEGLRNTTTLRGQGGNAGAPLHWTGNFDEVQDFEGDIRRFFGGTGFMSDAYYFAGTRSLPLGDPKAGLSADLDDLAAYLASLRAKRSPQRQPDGAMTAAALQGQTLFNMLGCQNCHSGPRFSDSASGVRHDVGTLKPSSGQRSGGTLDGLDTPTLLGLAATGPYLHDGSAPTLRDVLTTANPAGLHGNVNSLTDAEIDALVEYLLQLEEPEGQIAMMPAHATEAPPRSRGASWMASSQIVSSLLFGGLIASLMLVQLPGSAQRPLRGSKPKQRRH
jgi:cytochrome c553